MNRKCGECTLCCRLVPVEQIRKPANTRCPAQGLKGCRVYQERPMSCIVWSCGWLVQPDTINLGRPDRSHYVIDTLADSVTANSGTEGIEINAIQIWCDPKHPDAHRDPKLREYLSKKWDDEKSLGLIRYGSDKAITLIPPQLSDTGNWQEHVSEIKRPQRPIGL